MKLLTIKELQEALEHNQFITFHPDFQHEGWKDGEKGPLQLIDVYFLRDCYYVGYKCSRKDCWDCSLNDGQGKEYEDTYKPLRHHYQLLKEDGFHIYERAEIIEGKKNTIIKWFPNPVFVKCEEK